MKSRRTFIKLGAGVAFSTFAFTSTAKQIISTKASPNKTISGTNANKDIVIGIIGTENSHSIDFCKAFNIESHFPGIRVEYIWGETEELAKKAMEKSVESEQWEDVKYESI